MRRDSAGSGPWDAKKDSITTELTVLGKRKTMVDRSKERGSDVGLTVVDQQASINRVKPQHNSQPRQSRSSQRNKVSDITNSQADMQTPLIPNRLGANSISYDIANETNSKNIKTGATRTRQVYRERSSEISSNHQSGMAPVPAIFKNSESTTGKALTTLAVAPINCDLPEYSDGVDPLPIIGSGKVTPAQSTKRLIGGASTEEPSIEKPLPAMVIKNLFASIIDSEVQMVKGSDDEINDTAVLEASDRSNDKKRIKQSK